MSAFTYPALVVNPLPLLGPGSLEQIDLAVDLLLAPTRAPMA